MVRWSIEGDNTLALSVFCPARGSSADVAWSLL